MKTPFPDLSRASVAIFDLDRTLTRHPTYSHFLLSAGVKLAPLRLLANLPFIAGKALCYRLGRCDRRALKEAMHQAALGPQLPGETAETLADAFADTLFANGLYSEAREQIAAEQGRCHHVIIATAAPELYVRPLARRLGIHHVIATRNRWADHNLVPRIDGDNCYGPAKCKRIDAFLDENGILRSAVSVRFYSDDVSDLPTFLWADEPVAVNPDRRLRKFAEQAGWPVLDWGKRRKFDRADRASSCG
ncbi:MAG TPA: HAD-IB family hydrolase [Chakrabartia sp.]|jgi:HAD superfamily hydrolase (TIGR01490 family)|nr:HAD-IB family hydrolase [Chakrabartia sp.]